MSSRRFLFRAMYSRGKLNIQIKEQEGSMHNLLGVMIMSSAAWEHLQQVLSPRIEDLDDLISDLESDKVDEEELLERLQRLDFYLKRLQSSVEFET